MYLVLGTILLFSCKKDLPMSSFFSTTPFIIETPFGFSDMNIPSNNPMTVEGIALDFPSVEILGPIPWGKSSGKASTIIFWKKGGDWRLLRAGEVLVRELY